MKSKKPLANNPTPCPGAPPPTREQIAALAHAIWIDRGRPEGRDVDHWLEAERQLTGGEVRPTMAADELPADVNALEPDATLRGPIERELDRISAPREQRSPTSM
jgi:hypothetical protein